MSEILRDFVVNVATDPELAMRFGANPMAELERTSLSGEEKAILLARDSGRLREAIGAARKGVANVIFKKKGGKKKGGKKKGRRTPAKKAGRVKRAR